MTSAPLFAYVVMSYDAPDLIRRLLHRIRVLSPEAIIVLRHDSRRCQPPDDLPAGVHLGDDGPIEWGDWSMVEGVLRELRWVRDHTAATHAVVISGQDYPTRRLTEWEASVQDLDAVIHAERLHFRPRWGRRRGYLGDETMIRYAYRWFRVPTSGRWDFDAPLARLINRVAFRLISNVRPLAYYRILPHRRGLFVGVRRRWSTPTYKGWPWMMLSRRAIDHLLGADLSAYERALIPEEAAIQSTVLINDELDTLIGTVSFTSWPDDPSVSHPDVLGDRHLEAIRASDSPFARKVELSPLLGELDMLAETRSGTH